MTGRKSEYSYNELLKCANGELFAPDSPKLPLPPMLMLDRITHISDSDGSNGKGSIAAELDINTDLWFFKCHFQGDPVMPGCLGIDALWQMLGFYVGWIGGIGVGRALGVGNIKFSDMVLPNVSVLKYGVDVKRVIKGKLYVAVADGWLELDNKKIYEISDLRVGVFKKKDV